MNTLSYTQDKIEAYWIDKPIKSWVVKLESGRREKFDSETKFVRAKNQNGAIRTAKQYSFLKGKIRCSFVRLMGPSDVR